MKEVWRPRLLDRSMWDAWVAAGREDAYEKATGLARRLVDDHQVVPLEPDTAAALARIAAEASGPSAGPEPVQS